MCEAVASIALIHLLLKVCRMRRVPLFNLSANNTAVIYQIRNGCNDVRLGLRQRKGDRLGETDERKASVIGDLVEVKGT